MPFLRISSRKWTRALKWAMYVVFVIFTVYLIKIWTMKIEDDDRPTIKPCNNSEYFSKNVTLQFKDYKIDYQLFKEKDKPNLCDKKKVVVFVASAPQNFHTRLMIRESWANKETIPPNFLILFLVGAQSDPKTEEHLDIEAHFYHDLIRYNSLDAYRRLFVKTHAAFEWFQWNCENASYFIKADDDAVLHLKRIDQFIEHEAKAIVTQKPESMFCNVKKNHHPFRNPWSKLYVPFSSFPSYTFPDYCQGGAYMLTRQSVSQILVNTNGTNLVQLEDVLYTGLIGQQIGLNFYATPAFCYEENESSCLLNSTKIPQKAASCAIDRQQIREEFRKLDSLTCYSTGHFNSITSIFILCAILVTFW